MLGLNCPCAIEAHHRQTSMTIDPTISAVPAQLSNIIDTIAVSRAVAARIKEKLKGQGLEMGLFTRASRGIHA